MGSDASGSIEPSVFKPALILTAGRTLGFVASFAMPIVLVRVFSQGEFGTYKQLFLIYATLYSIGQCGMAESLFYFLPGNPPRAGGFILNSVLGLALSGGACLALLILVARPLGIFFHNRALERDAPLIGIFLLLMLIAATLEIVMTVKNRHGLAFFSYAFSDVVRAALCIGPALLADGVHGLLLGAIAFAALRCATTLGYLYSQYRHELRLDMRQLRAQLGYALPFAAAVLIDVAQNNLHFYAVSSYFNAATYAVYAVGCLQVPLVDHLMTMTCNVMMVRMREHQGQAAALAILRDATRKLAMMFAPLVVLLLVVSHRLIITLFTARYARSVPIFRVWSISLLLPALLTDGALRVYAQNRYLMLVNAAKLAVVACLVVWFLRMFGLVGAVLATLLAALIGKAMAMVRIRRLLRCSVRQLLPWRSLAGIAVVAAAAALPALALQSTLRWPGLPLLAATTWMYVLAYVAALYGFGPLTRQERCALLGWARTPAVRLLRDWRSS
jgi:O-antigen/teichoic acid export membrane protein